ncbi:flippase-like domain-containing protein [Acetobacteraceae bacterium]|nr:flippase-like domain-containing protein [Acetobacteraceae bacterium]
MKKQIFKLTLGILIGATFLAILCHHLDISKVWSEIKKVDTYWLSLSLTAIVISFVVRAERWRQILKPINPKISLLASWRIFIIGLAGNVVLPFRLGDFFRGTFFARHLNVPVGALMTSILIEKMCDLVFIVLLGGFALFAVPEVGHAEAFHIGGSMIFLIGAIAITFLFCARWLRRPVMYCAEKVLSPFPVKLSEKLLTIAGHVFMALDFLARPLVMTKVMVLSAITWIFEWMTFVFVAMGISSLHRPLGAMVAMPLATLSTALPGAPAGLGTFDFFAEEAMKLIGNSRDASTAYAFLVHAVILGATVILAVLALLGQDLKAPSSANEEEIS